MKNILYSCCLLLASAAYAQPAYWQPVASGTGKDLLSISFGSATTGYIGGKDSLLLKTTDGGLSWQPLVTSGLDFSAASPDVVDVFFTGADTGYAIVSNEEAPIFQGALYRTADGGLSWSLVDAGAIAARRSYFFRDGNGFVTGAAFFAGATVSRLSDGMLQHYHNLSYDPAYLLQSIDCRDEQRAVTGGADGKVYRTFDGGQHWDTIQTPTDSAIYAVRYLNDSVLLAGVNSNGATLLLSRDAGATWSVDMNSLTFDYPVMRGIITSSLDSFIAVGASGTFEGKGTLYWHDGQHNRMQTVDHALYGIARQSGPVAYAVGKMGLIVTNRGQATSLPGPADLSVAAALYPNPASGMVTVSLPVKYTLRIFDLCGRLVFRNDTPVSEQQVDLKEKAAGVYTVQLETGKGCIYKNLVLR